MPKQKSKTRLTENIGEDIQDRCGLYETVLPRKGGRGRALDCAPVSCWSEADFYSL